MKNIMSTIRILTMTIIALLAFGPPTQAEPRRLRPINLNDNQLSSLPTNFIRFVALNDLNIDHNHLLGREEPALSTFNQTLEVGIREWLNDYHFSISKFTHHPLL